MFLREGFKFQVSSFKTDGFTFIELIVAVFVFIIGVLGSFLLSQHFIFKTRISVSRLTASYLSQEGIEIVRNLRDENWLNEFNWESGISTGNWQSSYNDAGLGVLQDDGLMYIDDNGLYSHDNTGLATNFKRRITLQSIDESIPPDGVTDYIKAVVSINWEEKGESYQLEARENLYPWWSD